MYYGLLGTLSLLYIGWMLMSWREVPGRPRRRTQRPQELTPDLINAFAPMTAGAVRGSGNRGR